MPPGIQGGAAGDPLPAGRLERGAVGVDGHGVGPPAGDRVVRDDVVVVGGARDAGAIADGRLRPERGAGEARVAGGVHVLRPEHGAVVAADLQQNRSEVEVIAVDLEAGAVPAALGRGAYAPGAVLLRRG